MELATALGVTVLVAWAFVWHRIFQQEACKTRDTLRHEAQRLEQKVDTCVRATTGARMLAESAIVCAQRAEERATRAVVLVMSPANDDGIPRDESKKR